MGDRGCRRIQVEHSFQADHLVVVHRLVFIEVPRRLRLAALETITARRAIIATSVFVQGLVSTQVSFVIDTGATLISYRAEIGLAADSFVFVLLWLSLEILVLGFVFGFDSAKDGVG